MSSVLCCCLRLSQVSADCSVYELSFVLLVCLCVWVPVSVCLCIYALTIVSMDKILHFINTFIIIIMYSETGLI